MHLFCVNFQSSSCIDGWTYYNQSCYKYVSEFKHWNQSNVYCSSLHSSAQLVVITDVKEREFVISYIDNVTVGTLFMTPWVGATDFYGSEGDYQWVTGELWTWVIPDDWADGEPSDVMNTFSMEDCISISMVPKSLSDSGKWYDQACTTLETFICEYNLNTG